GDRVSVRRPRRVALHHLGGIRKVADIAFFARHGEDLSAHPEDSSRPGWGDSGELDAPRFDFLEVRPHLCQVAGKADSNVANLARLEIEQVQGAELLVDNRAWAGRS